MPLRGVIGSDIQKHRKDWCIIPNPMNSSGIKDEPILLLPAASSLIFFMPLVLIEMEIFKLAEDENLLLLLMLQKKYLLL